MDSNSDVLPPKFILQLALRQALTCASAGSMNTTVLVIDFFRKDVTLFVRFP
jgi:hypothetical protein